METAVLINFIVFGSIALIVYIIVSQRHKEKMELIEQGVNPVGVPAPGSLLGSKSLLWGLIFMALGVSAIIYFIIVGEIEEQEILFPVIAAFFCGGALIFYHRLTARQREWGMRLYEKKITARKPPVKNNCTA
ncbi:MAG TPA: DUF6249 domain-containing protein [archaeon]|nr:DUF6249 domain-containing protein [archaeon]